jgi:hypothetical protein
MTGLPALPRLPRDAVAVVATEYAHGGESRGVRQSTPETKSQKRSARSKNSSGPAYDPTISETRAMPNLRALCSSFRPARARPAVRRRGPLHLRPPRPPLPLRLHQDLGRHRVAHDHEGTPVGQPGGKFLGDVWGHVVAPRVWTLGDFTLLLRFPHEG